MTTDREMNLLRRQNLGDSLRRSARAAGDKTAIIFYATAGESRELSYASLDRMANVVANNLMRRGARPTPIQTKAFELLGLTPNCSQ